MYKIAIVYLVIFQLVHDDVFYKCVYFRNKRLNSNAVWPKGHKFIENDKEDKRNSISFIMYNFEFFIICKSRLQYRIFSVKEKILFHTDIRDI